MPEDLAFAIVASVAKASATDCPFTSANIPCAVNNTPAVVAADVVSAIVPKAISNNPEADASDLPSAITPCSTTNAELVLASDLVSPETCLARPIAPSVSVDPFDSVVISSCVANIEVV